MSLETALQDATNAMNRLVAALGTPLTAAQAKSALEGQANVPAATPAKAAPAPNTGKVKATAPAAPAALSYDTDVKPKVLKFGEVKGREALVALLAEFGLTKANACPADKLADLAQRLDAGIAEAAEALA